MVTVLVLPVFLLSFVLAIGVEGDWSTREDRSALFDYLLAKTMERESFSPVKNRNLGLDVEKEMLRYKEELLSADSDDKLYYALVKISNARKDRHLRVDLVEGGVTLAGYTDEPMHAPVRFFTDYSNPEHYFIFVGDYAKNIAEFTGGKVPEVGDKLVAINDQPIDDYVKDIEPYHRYSTVNGFWWKLALWIPQKSHIFPPRFYRENVTFSLESKNGDLYALELPYLAPDTIDWSGHGERKYPGFSLAFSTETYDLYRSDEGKPILIIAWHGFRAQLVEDMDRLMDYAAEHQLLDHAIIWDGTRSGGGSKGAYAVQRLSPKPFKTTFGNLRLSDVTPLFIERKRNEFKEKKLLDSGVSETIDDGTWLMAWLEDDVTKGIRDGQAYSNNIPFKLAHLPKYSDGIIKPADVHFRGPMVCFLGPHGGSHLDQFVSIVVDNDLAHTMGMPVGGYSNTWEWEEVLKFPISGKPIVRYMWSIGHTIRPNGEILEGNPARVDELIPLTRESYTEYYPMLISRALRHLGLE
jgi:hypothetical protein